jgi:hypothetical protein
MSFISNIKAGFAVVAILVVTWIGNAIAGQAANVATCIATANSSDASSLNNTCTSDTHGVQNGVNKIIDNQKGGRF